MRRGKKTKIFFLKSLLEIIELNNQAELQTSDGSYKCINNRRKGSWIYQLLMSASEIPLHTFPRQSALRHSVHTNLICALAELLLWKTKYYFMSVLTLHLDSILREYMAPPFFCLFLSQPSVLLTMFLSWPACSPGKQAIPCFKWKEIKWKDIIYAPFSYISPGLKHL